MSNAPRPISFTQRAAVAGEPVPAPEVIVGSLPSGAFPATALTVVPGSFADLAAVRTYLATLVGELKASPYFN